jgi:hypothetical protein
MATAEAAYLDRLLDPLTQCFTPSVAQQVIDLRADPAVQARLEELAEKSTEGELSPKERSEYRTYVTALDLIGILQAKARALVADR